MGVYLLAFLLGACGDGDIETDAKTPKSTNEQIGGAETCKSAPEQGSVFQWEIVESFNDKKTKVLSVETILAKRGSLTLRLLELDYENGGREVSNPLHYGPLYIGELEDFVEVDSIYDAAGLARAFPDHVRLLADIETQIRRDDRSYLFTAFDEVWRSRSSGTTQTYKYGDTDEDLSLSYAEDHIPFFDLDAPTSLFVIHRVRPLRSGGSSTRSFWFTKEDCLMVRYSTSFVIETSSQSKEGNLVHKED